MAHWVDSDDGAVNLDHATRIEWEWDEEGNSVTAYRVYLVDGTQVLVSDPDGRNKMAAVLLDANVWVADEEEEPKAQ